MEFRRLAAGDMSKFVNDEYYMYFSIAQSCGQIAPLHNRHLGRSTAR
jgi:hypothetical protein